MMGWFTRGRKSSISSSTAWDWSLPLVSWSRQDHWTLADAVQGCQIFGGTGSGKTTGALACLILAFLRAGFGGLILTTKPTDRAFYEALCRAAGRSQDLLVWGIDGRYRFNPIDAEVRRRDAGGGLTENIVALLGTLLEISERDRGDSNREDSGYWQRALRQLLRNCIDLLMLSQRALNIHDLYRLVISAPVSLDQVNSENWKRSSFCFQSLEQAERHLTSPRQRNDLSLAMDYFLYEFPNLSDRTRSVIVSTFTSMLDVLQRGPIREILGSDSNVEPEMAQEGTIFLMDFPIKVHGELGLMLQVLFKFCFQRAMERRNVEEQPRPTFIVVDESHFFTVSSDQQFQTTARSSRTAVVYATQSRSNYLAALGHDKEAEVDSLLGNLQTQIFHQQSNIQTNQYAAELIGRSRQFLVNSNTSRPAETGFGITPFGQDRQVTAGVNEVFEYEVQPNRFCTLRKGGPPHWQVDGILFQGGRRFSTTNRPWMPVTFDQFL